MSTVASSLFHGTLGPLKLQRHCYINRDSLEFHHIHCDHSTNISVINLSHNLLQVFSLKLSCAYRTLLFTNQNLRYWKLGHSSASHNFPASVKYLVALSVRVNRAIYLIARNLKYIDIEWSSISFLLYILRLMIALLPLRNDLR